ncbi:MAG: cytidine deaminase [Acidimicrobiia bacterium]|nr:cytidine deaminase [Acidimicrobiia bacterium]
MSRDPGTGQPPLKGDHVDWDKLRFEARAMTSRAYAPYSGFSVGAAALTTSGRIVRGCNVENVSYGLSLCAECGLVSDAIQHAAGKIIGMAVVSGDGQYCSPCGRCRQLLVEHSTGDALIDTPSGPILISSLLPDHFDQDRLDGG